MPEHLHLLEPAWLLLAIPAAVLLWWRLRSDNERGPWSGVIDRRLQPLLLTSAGNREARLPVWLLGLGWLIALLALANPAWEKAPAPLWQAGAARVIVLDLSRSMLAADLRPTRLFHARLKVEDLLSLDDGAEIGLVAFAGDAFTVAPLTRDAATLRALLKVLEPGIMPAQGSRVDLALAQAHELLRQADAVNGEVILIADGVGDAASALGVAAELLRDGHRVSVLGVGTSEGAPLPGGRGGRPFMVGLDQEALAAIAKAGGGRYVSLSPGGGDTEALLLGGSPGERTDDGLRTWHWQGRGVVLLLLLLPLAALAFRRGWLMALLLIVGLPLPSQPVFASVWEDAWSRPDQQAANALAEGRYERARLAEDPMVSGAAAYRQGRYAEAERAFATVDGSDAAYNRGNALARMGRYREAVAAYDTALAMTPGMPDAIHNKTAIEALLRSQQRPGQDEHSREDDNRDADQAKSSNQDNAQPSDQSAQQSEQGSDETGAEDSDATQGDTDDAQEQAGGDADASTDGDDSGGEQDVVQGDDAGEQGGETASASGNGGSDGQGQSGDGSASSDAGGSQRSLASSGGRDDGEPSRQGQHGESEADAGDLSDPDAHDPGRQLANADRIEDHGAPGPQSTDQVTDPSARNGQDSGTRGPEERSRKDGAQGRADGRGDEAGQSFAEANRRLDDRLGDDSRDAGDDVLGLSPDARNARRSGHPDITEGRPAPGGLPDGEKGGIAGAPLTAEERLAAQQWLRRIPDDPGGLLRRKFLLQYRQRGRAPQDRGQDW